MKIDLRLVSPLEKVFIDQPPKGGYAHSSALLGETASFQAAWRIIEGDARGYVNFRVVSEAPVRVRRVRSVPVYFTTFPDADDDYLRKAPGLFPDALEECPEGPARAYKWMWECAWIDIEGAAAGDYVIDVIIEDIKGAEIGRERFLLHVINAVMPKQALIHTKWFHCDCLCRYYGVAMWSEKFWEICENFVRAAARRGINMLLTPIHTPPLDTAEGGERMTCQLVDIKAGNSGYEFDFSRLERWVEMAKRAGMEYFEMAHLFTQWGAKHAPKIIADVCGEEKRIFGWDTEATGTLYRDFLRQYLPALTAELRRLGIDKKTFFHISDEPSIEMLEDYRAAREMVSKYLEGYPIVDAMSSYEFYRTGAIQKPIPAINHIGEFVDNKVPGLWAYYCIGQYKNVSNMFMAMPSRRNRILGVQLYKFDIEGFLQWGYNFYSSQGSVYPVNPWADTSGDGFTPAGDAFQVYPGKDGQPVESLRMMVTWHALCDLGAFRLLESLTSKERVMEIIEDGIAPITFDEYPRDAEYLPGLRARVNAEIERLTAK